MIENHFARPTYLFRWMKEKRGGEIIVRTLSCHGDQHSCDPLCRGRHDALEGYQQQPGGVAHVA